MFIVRLAGDHLYGKWLLTWLSLAISLIVSYFGLSFYPGDVLDEIWDGIKCVSEIVPANQTRFILFISNKR